MNQLMALCCFNMYRHSKFCTFSDPNRSPWAGGPLFQVPGLLQHGYLDFSTVQRPHFKGLRCLPTDFYGLAYCLCGFDKILVRFCQHFALVLQCLMNGPRAEMTLHDKVAPRGAYLLCLVKRYHPVD